MVYKAIIKLPTYSKGRGEKKRTNLFSMNVYRNMHYLSLNKVKQDYHKEVEEWVKALPKFKSLTPKYILFFKGKRKKDIDNYTFPMHKFLMDALVENNIIEDDHYEYVTKITTEFGGLDTDNYVVVEIKGEEHGTEQE